MAVTLADFLQRHRDALERMLQKMPIPNERRTERLIELPYLQPARRAYLVNYYAVALPAVLRPHRLKLPAERVTYQVRFLLTHDEQQAWFALFGLESELGKKIPLTYAATAATPVFMHLLNSLGINFKYVRHVASEMDVLTAEPALRAGELYTYMASLEDIFAIGRGRIVLELGSRVFDEAQRLRAVHTDYFMVTNFKEESLAVLNNATPHKASRFASVSAYTRELDGTGHCLSIPPLMGVRYGQLSGDMNIVHTTALAARLMGFAKPFIQGFCTVNLVLSRLATEQNMNVRRLHCTFARPVFVAETPELFSEGETFELCNKGGKVLAYGKAFGEIASRKSNVVLNPSGKTRSHPGHASVTPSSG